MSGAEETPAPRFGRPLRIAALVKQIPVGESMVLGSDRRMVRQGLELEMNAYCRRAVSKGVEWAKASGGTCTVFTLGPPSAEDVLREAVAWGADNGVHLCDPVFAGSDTLATARALSAAVKEFGAFDLVLVGRNSLDGETGQVPPEIAELSGLPFASGVRDMGLSAETLTLTLEHDDGWEDALVKLPALLSVAERLCEPCKVPPGQRAEVADDKIRRVLASQLGDGPWGEAGSPTVVGSTRVLHHDRAGRVFSGELEDQVAAAVELLAQRGALTRTAGEAGGPLDRPNTLAASSSPDAPPARVIAVIIEAGRPQVGAELRSSPGPSKRESMRCLSTMMTWHRSGNWGRTRSPISSAPTSPKTPPPPRWNGRPDNLFGLSWGPARHSGARFSDGWPLPSARDWWEMPSGSRLPTMT
jgi:electron transfer flavoprotein alpha subunit